MPAQLRMCGNHMEDLAKELKFRGLWHLVELDPAKAAAWAQRYKAGQTQPDEFDPLAASVGEILTKVPQFIDDRLILTATGFRCPLCLLVQHTRQLTAAQKAVKDVAHLAWLRVEVINRGKRVSG